jgi:hypothetical protein
MGASQSLRSSGGVSDTVILDDAPGSPSPSDFTDSLRTSLQRLMLYAQSSDRSLQKEVAERLANEAVRQDRQAQIVECGGLKLLVPLMQSPDLEVQRLAAHALANLSALPANQRAIVSTEGALSSLVALLSRPAPEVQRQAAKAIANISVVPENMALIAGSGTIAPLLALMSAAQVKTRIEAIAAIANLAVNPGNEALLVAAGALQTVLSCLQGSGLAQLDEDLTVQCARALRTLSRTAEHARLLQSLGGDKLLTALSASGSASARAQAKVALEHLAGGGAAKREGADK